MRHYIKHNINDYRRITSHDTYNLTVDDTNKFNDEAINFIKNNIVDDSKKYIVLTHHAPLFSSSKDNYYTADKMYYNGPNNEAFHNDLRDIIKSPIVLWCYGHTHYVSKFLFNGVTVWTNQYGYAHEKIMFNPNDTFTIE
jgi:hypothetical protein